MSSIPVKFYVERRWTVRCKGMNDSHVLGGSFPATVAGKEQAEDMAKRFQDQNDKEVITPSERVEYPEKEEPIRPVLLEFHFIPASANGWLGLG